MITQYRYDDNGNQQVEMNLLGLVRTTTTWNYENQPTLVEKPDGSRITTTYNSDNRRVEVEE